MLYKHNHLDYLHHITGHFPEKPKARPGKGNPTSNTQLGEARHSVFRVHTTRPTAETVG